MVPLVSFYIGVNSNHAANKSNFATIRNARIWGVSVPPLGELGRNRNPNWSGNPICFFRQSYGITYRLTTTHTLQMTDDRQTDRH